jgi:hypothetical protein
MSRDRRTGRLVLLSAAIAGIFALVFVLLRFFPAMGPVVRTVAYALMGVGVVIIVVAVVRRRSR